MNFKKNLRAELVKLLDWLHLPWDEVVIINFAIVMLIIFIIIIIIGIVVVIISII